MGEAKYSPRRVDASQKQIKALELRANFWTYDEIAKELGYSSHSGAVAAVKTGMEKTLQEAGDNYRALTLRQLTKILEVNWPRMLDGDIPSTKVCLDTIKQTRELMGTDAPTKHEVSGVDGNPIQHEGVTLDIGDITEALQALQDVGAVRLENNGYAPIALDALHTPQADT